MQNYSIAKDKLKLHENSNVRLNNRDMLDIQINKDRNGRNSSFNRIDIERDEFMKNSNSDEQNNMFNSNLLDNSLSNSNDSSDFRGMPMRGNYNISDSYNNNQNNDISFLKGNHIPNLDHVDYFDPITKDNFGGLADINQNTQLSSQLKNKSICSDGINILAYFMFNNLYKLLNIPFIINNFGLYNVFVPLYIASKGNTEIELKNYFLYPRRDIIQDGMNELLQILKKTDYINTDSCILLNRNLDINSDYCATMTNITKIRTFNASNSNIECETINRIINTTLKNNMKKTLTSDSLKNTVVNLINYSYINPVWFHPFNKSFIDAFLYRNTSQIKQEFMECNNDFFGYTEDQNKQIIELKCDNTNLVMGIILSKEKDIVIDEKQINSYVKNMKPVKFGRVVIPKFKVQTKLRYNSFLQQTNLRTVFMDLNVHDMLSDSCGAKLTDVIQNIEINVTNMINTTQQNSQNDINGRSLIVNRSFIFYFRIPDINLIPFIGYY
jgi:hypothetical protein